jgi:hypothetical protein
LEQRLPILYPVAPDQKFPGVGVNILELHLRVEPDARLVRERELTAKLATLDGEWEQLEKEIRLFWAANFVTAGGGTMCIRAGSVDARPEIEVRARVLAQRMDKVRALRDATLKELSEL